MSAYWTPGTTWTDHVVIQPGPLEATSILATSRTMHKVIHLANLLRTRTNVKLRLSAAQVSSQHKNKQESIKIRLGPLRKEQCVQSRSTQNSTWPALYLTMSASWELSTKGLKSEIQSLLKVESIQSGSITVLSLDQSLSRFHSQPLANLLLES